MPLVVEDEVRAGLDTQSPWRLDWLSGIAGMARFDKEDRPATAPP